MPARTVAAVLAALLPAPVGEAAQQPDRERGRALYESHCVACHTSKVHRRFPTSAIDVEALRFIVTVWSEENKLYWGRGEIEDVVRYLDRTYYRFPR